MPLLVALVASCGREPERPTEPAASREPAAAATAIESTRPHGVSPYRKVGGIAGSVSSVGSDSLGNVVTLWAEAFRGRYPNVKVQIEAKGSATAPTALVAGLAQLGPMSRVMKPTEIDAFEKKYGYKPTAIRVAVDGIAIYVHRDNPLEEITLPQIDAIFSRTRHGGHPRDIRTWGDLGLTGEWASRRISLYGRNSVSGTYAHFKERALYGGDFRDMVKEQPGSAAVVQAVTEDPYAIGYSGIGYRTSGVKVLKLAEKEGAPHYEDAPEDVLEARYPLARFLFVYVNKAPDRPLDPLAREFLRFALSAEGQEIVAKDGYLPVPVEILAGELTKL